MIRRAPLSYLLSHSHHRGLSLSSVCGSTYPPLDDRTIWKYFTDSIQSRLARPALISPQEPPRPHGGPISENMGITTHLGWTYSEFDQHIKALARGLVSLGVKKGEHVAVIMGSAR